MTEFWPITECIPYKCMKLTVPSPFIWSVSISENVLQLGSCLDMNFISFFSIYLLVWSFLFATENTLLGNSFGDKHLYHTQNWWRTAFKCSHCWWSVHVYQFLLTCHCLARFYCQYLEDDKTFFLLFTGAGSSWLESTIVLFLLLLRWDCRIHQVTTSFLMLLPGHTL